MEGARSKNIAVKAARRAMPAISKTYTFMPGHQPTIRCQITTAIGSVFAFALPNACGGCARVRSFELRAITASHSYDCTRPQSIDIKTAYICRCLLTISIAGDLYLLLFRCFITISPPFPATFLVMETMHALPSTTCPLPPPPL